MEQQPQEQQQQVAPYNYMPENKADLLDKIRPETIVETVRFHLMGMEIDPMTGKWLEVEYLKGRALSKLGAWEISTLMLPVSSQNVTISNLTEDEIKRRALGITMTAIEMCVKNWRDYGITGEDQIDYVAEIVFSNTLITLKHPLNAGVRNFIGHTTTEFRQVSNQEPKHSWFSWAQRAKDRR